MQVVTGAMGSLLPKLGQLLMEEYNLQKNAKKGIESLIQEMKSMHAVLCKVAEVPRHQLDEQVKLWADEVRDLSYDIEDIVDNFLVHVEVGSSKPVADGNKLTDLVEKMANLFTKGKARRQIASAIKDINREIQEVANRRGRYTVDNIVPKPTVGTTIDPRLRALYTEVTELVGIYGKRDQELLKLLSLGDEDPSNKRPKIVSVVGFGGLGKTTLVRAVYDKIKGGFDSRAFVPVGQNPDMKKIFRDILIGLDKNMYTNINLMVLDERQLIEEIREFLHDKRYLVVIDDIWDGKLWGDIKLAFSNMNNLGSRLITTTRIFSVSIECCPSTHDSIYQMEPLSDSESTRLFCKRIFSSENKCPSELKEVSRDILKKCGSVPLAILTVASLLTAGHQIKPKVEWQVLLDSIGRGLTEDANMEEMQRILSFSYYDLPSHLKTCRLYLCMYPEDHEIDKEDLIWKWICEKFVQHEKHQTSIFEVGETYFNELINRHMIIPIFDGFCEVKSCRVHDMVLDLIRSLSAEAKFLTILESNKDITSPHSNIRRLSLQNIEEDQQSTPLTNSMSISKVRYLVVIDDIWDGKLWGDIKLAFSNMNNLGSRLITTTRIFSVSIECCPSTHDSIYQMEPLSDSESTRLFCKRIFSSENKCPSELKEVSRDILKKCGGVPLAILTIASLLTAGHQIKPKVEWQVLLDLIERGLIEDASMEEMQRILSFSYYDLPSHLKTCLLYLCMYPEDHEIDKEDLIWKWICEKCVQHEKHQTSIFEVGETYFNELINRHMIIPIFDGFCEVKSCRVHDMVLDLIRSLSAEAKFLTILESNKDITSPHSNIRRLSLQNIEEDQQSTPLTNSMSISKVRSVTVFPPAVTIMPAISSFGVLRVLDLCRCRIGALNFQPKLRDIGCLFHLRYLGLKETGISEIPEEIGNLQFLQVLDLKGNFEMRELPSSMWKLRQLMAVKVLFRCYWPPGVLANLTSLEVLERIYASLSTVQELGSLARLRELHMHFIAWSLEVEGTFVETICNLHDIQSLSITCNDVPYLDLLGGRWEPPRCLRKFHFTSEHIACSALPMWIMRCSPSHLSNLSWFNIMLKEVQQEDVQILRWLPALRHLNLWSTHQTERLLVIGADGFRSVVDFLLYCQPANQVVFQQGALPNAEVVRFNLGVRLAMEDGNGDVFELGLGNLLSLQDVVTEIHWDGVTVKEAKEAWAGLRNALNTHPNRPLMCLLMEPDMPEDTDDEDDDEYDDDDSEDEGERMDLD